MVGCTHVVIRAVVCPSTVTVWVRVSLDTKTTVTGVGVAVEVTTTVTVSSSELDLKTPLCVADGGAIVITIGSLKPVGSMTTIGIVAFGGVTVMGHWIPPVPSVTVMGCVGAAGYAGYRLAGDVEDAVMTGVIVVDGWGTRSGFCGNEEKGCG